MPRYPDKEGTNAVYVWLLIIAPAFVLFANKEKAVDLESIFGILFGYYLFLGLVYLLANWLSVGSLSRLPSKLYGDLLEAVPAIWQYLTRASRWLQYLLAFTVGIPLIIRVLVTSGWVPEDEWTVTTLFVGQKIFEFGLLFGLIYLLVDWKLKSKPVALIAAIIGTYVVFTDFFINLTSIQTSAGIKSQADLWELGALHSSKKLLWDLVIGGISQIGSLVLVVSGIYLDLFPWLLRFPMAVSTLFFLQWAIFGVKFSFACQYFGFMYSQNGLFTRVQTHSRREWRKPGQVKNVNQPRRIESNHGNRPYRAEHPNWAQIGGPQRRGAYQTARNWRE